MRRVLTLVYENVSFIIFGIISIYLCVSSFFYTSYISIDWQEYTFFLSDKPIRNLMMIFFGAIRRLYC